MEKRNYGDPDLRGQPLARRHASLKSGGSCRPPLARGYDLRRRALPIRQERKQPIGSLARLRGGANDRMVVLAQDLE